MLSNCRPLRRFRFEPLEPRLMLAVTLTNEPGGGTASFDVDETGSSNTGYFDPIGELERRDVIFRSGVVLRSEQLDLIDFLDSISGGVRIISQDEDSLVSEFFVDSLRIELVQTLLPLFHDGLRNGSQWVQTYTIINLGESAAQFDLIRYLDADLHWGAGNNDDGGQQIIDGVRILYETDLVDEAHINATYVGITATGGEPVSQFSFEIGQWSTLRNQILAGNELQDSVLGDVDGDGLIDNPNTDIALALRSHFDLLPGEKATYVTTTILGTGDVIVDSDDEVPTPPSEQPSPEQTLPEPVRTEPTVEVVQPEVVEQPSLLLIVRPPARPPLVTASYGTDGYVQLSEQSTEVANAMPAQAIDAALAGDDFDEGLLLAGFLDFVDPEMLVVDLGDEPPGEVAADAAKTSPTAESPSVMRGGSHQDQTTASAPAEQAAGSVEYMKPAIETPATPSAFGSTRAQLQGLAAEYWQWFATTGAVLLFSGAAWKSRGAWLQVAKKMWSR